MKDKWKFFGRLANSDIMHYLRFAVLPLAAVVLIAVIMTADKGKEGQTSPENTGTVLAGSTADGEAGRPAGEDSAGGGEQSDIGAGEAGGQESGEAGGQESGEASGQESGESSGQESGGPGDGAGGEPADGADRPSGEGAESSGAAEDAPDYSEIDISQYTLKTDEVPELLALVRTYCQAKEDCDPQLMARLFGRGVLTEEEAAEEKAKMELVKASVKRYENISCYSIEGPEPDSYVIFPYFELKYREAETLMPQLTWAYVTKQEDGSYVMQEQVSEEVAAYIARIGERDDVAALRAQVAEAQAAAVASDEKLKSVYSGESEVVIGS